MKKLIVVLTIFFWIKTEAQSSVLSVADSLYDLGNYSKAIATYSEYSPQKDTYEPIAKAYQSLGNYDQAMLYYDKALRSDSTNVMIKYNYAKLLARTKNFKLAKAYFLELIDSDYKNPNFHYELGSVLERSVDSLGEAQNRFHSAYELDNSHQKAIYKIAKFHLVKRHHELVDKYVDSGLESFANNRELISLKAQNFFWQEMYDDAAVWFQKLVDLGESSLFLHEKLGFCYLRLYDNENAMKHVKKALKYEPQSPTKFYILCQIYGKKK